MDEGINFNPKRRILQVRSAKTCWHVKLMGRYQFALGPPTRSLVTSIALARFILHDELVPAFTCASLMGRTFSLSCEGRNRWCLVSEEGKGEIQLTSEDYLQGVIGMVNELVRPPSFVSTSISCFDPPRILCLSCRHRLSGPVYMRTGLTDQPRLSINSVTAQNFELPTRMATFVNDIFASYSLVSLNSSAPPSSEFQFPLFPPIPSRYENKIECKTQREGMAKIEEAEGWRCSWTSETTLWDGSLIRWSTISRDVRMSFMIWL